MREEIVAYLLVGGTLNPEKPVSELSISPSPTSTSNNLTSYHYDRILITCIEFSSGTRHYLKSHWQG